MPLVKIMLLLVCMAAAGACAPKSWPSFADETPGVFFEQDGSNLEELPQEELSEFLMDFDYILVGESHTNKCDHLIQARIIEQAVAAGMDPAVGLEMVSLENQPTLDAFNRGALIAYEMDDALNWRETWGHDFKGYLPIFEALERNTVPVYALNIPRRVLKSVGEEGLDNVSPADKAFLPSRVIEPLPEQREELEQSFNLHKQMNVAMGDLDGFLLSQSLWDTTMAESAVRLRKELKRPIIILAGSGHVAYGWGIAHRLETLDPEGERLLIMPWRGRFQPGEGEADLHFYCPEYHKSRLGFAYARTVDGMLVKDIDVGSRAEEAGFLVNDEILSVNGAALASPMVLHEEAVKASKADRILLFEVLRDDETEFIEMLLPERPKRRAPTE
jgi:uncharacterized iron-regulated protein